MVKMQFIPPTRAERVAAIGPTAGLPLSMQRALDPDAFQPIPPPGPEDWLAHHPEPGQTFEQFVRSASNRPDAWRHTVYLQPLGSFAPSDGAPLDQLQRFAAAFFAMDVAVLPALAVAANQITTRQNPYTHNRQLLTTDILALLRQRLPADAFAMLAITMEDLYPDPAWNFVFGQASLRQRVGVYSFARYDPRFFRASLPDNWQHLLLRRSCKVLAHETAHMFGISHCIFFHCLMNGSNHLAESDARPLYMCPVDLRKLYHSIGFDPLERYRQLEAVCIDFGFTDAAATLRAQIEHIEQG